MLDEGFEVGDVFGAEAAVVGAGVVDGEDFEFFEFYVGGVEGFGDVDGV